MHKPCTGRLHWEVVEEFGGSKDCRYDRYPVLLWKVTDVEQPGIEIEVQMPYHVMIPAFVYMLRNEKYIDYMRGRTWGGKKQELYFHGNHMICAIRKLFAEPIDEENIPEVYKLSHYKLWDCKAGTSFYAYIRRVFAWMCGSRATPGWIEERKKEGYHETVRGY